MVLLIAMRYSSFVRHDLDMLRRHFPVRCFHYAPSKRLVPNLWNQCALFLWLAANVRQASALVCWFADYHSLLPVLFARLFRRLCILILGGSDVNAVPEIGYGATLTPLRAFFVRQSIAQADRVVPVDPSLAAAALRQVPRIRGRLEAVPTGYDTRFWRRVSAKERCVLTVGRFEGRQAWMLKGIDLYLETARRLPGVRFILAGVNRESFGNVDWPSNVTALPEQSPESLRALYSRAKVYAQFSLSEGLPNVVCEAMLCECVPVGTAAGGIPNAVGSCGYVLRDRNAAEAVRLIRQALVASPALGRRARERAVSLYRSERRERIFIRWIHSFPLRTSGTP